MLRIDYAYEVRGMLAKTTSYSSVTGGTANVVDEVLDQYNNWGQLVREYQSHSGPVDVASTPHMDYGYADGSQNTIRLTSMTYPNGRVLTYGYNAGNDAAMSRVSYGLNLPELRERPRSRRH